VTIPRGQLKNLKASYTLTDPQLTAPLKKGQVVGRLISSLTANRLSSVR
jgi:D-alanyl-D-alanine carboxypeptidase (penicillin-binding protein 5/6)